MTTKTLQRRLDPSRDRDHRGHREDLKSRAADRGEPARLSPLANSRDARKAISKIIDPTLKRANEATDYAHAAIESLTQKSNPTMPDDVTAAMLAQEVRSALLRMDDAERRKAIATAISSGDESFVAAATSGSPVLSGLQAVEQAATREAVAI